MPSGVIEDYKKCLQRAIMHYQAAVKFDPKNVRAKAGLQRILRPAGGG